MAASNQNTKLKTDKVRINNGAMSVFLLTFTCLAFFSGCSGVSGIPQDPMGAQYEDRCYIEDSQFAFADQMYDRLGSMQLVEEELRNYYQWKPCEINEALYRLRKVNDLP